jgi:CubicO group peptidase (beta-lactamase class C family)
MADIEHDVRIAPDTVFYVGSLSKQFTAMAVALAIQQGRLSADDSIHKYLPELPDYGAPVTVRHLIHHTSGLRDYNTVLSVAGRRGDEAYDNPTVLRMTARQKQLNFLPGSEYLYSNTGYTLLAIIVERATRTAFASFADERIFKPLGMTVTHYGVDESRIVPRRAYAYARGQAGDVRLDTPHNERAGAGGVFTSVRDLLQWDENFYHARVGGKAVVEQLQKTGTLNDGTKLTYAWGLQVMTYRGLNIVEHSGSLGGYRAHLTRFPAQHLSIAALCNGSVSPGGMVRQVADVVLDGSFTAPRPAAAVNGGRGEAPSAARTPAAIPDASSYAGAYFSDEMDTTFTVTVDGGQLMLRRDSDSAAAAMVPAADGGFRARGMSMRFERGGDGRVGVLVIDAGRARDIRFVRK